MPVTISGSRIGDRHSKLSSNKTPRRRGVRKHYVSSPPRNDLLPKLSIEQISPHKLNPPRRRLRTYTDDDVLEMVGSIQSFGFSHPVIIGRDNKLVLDGDLRVAAARWLDLDTIPCVRLEHLTHAEERALHVALNRIGQRREWDLDELKLELEELILEDQPIQLLGFDGPELDNILLSEPISEAPPPEANFEERPICELDDIWQLGEHRLICGDACDEVVYSQLMQGDTAQLMLTDPPWNIKVSDIVSTKHREFAQASGEMTRKEFEEFLIAFLNTANGFLDAGAVELVFIDWRQLGLLLGAGEQEGLELLNIICWVKDQPAMGSLWRSQHEMIAALKKTGAKHKNNIQLGAKGRNRSNCWFAPGAGTMGSEARTMLDKHPTSKPVSLLMDAILDVSDRGDIVLDCFAGSGSTMIAAEKTDRRARLIELDPIYCDVILKRWEQEFGQEALLISKRETASPESIEQNQILETIDACAD